MPTVGQVGRPVCETKQVKNGRPTELPGGWAALNKRFQHTKTRQTQHNGLSSANPDFSDVSPLKPKLIMHPDSSLRRGYRATLITNHPTLLATSPTRGETAFTRLELLAVLAVLVLVAGVVLPVLAQGKPRSQQAICFNNLRAVGQAVLMFNVEHDQLDPWRESSNIGGTLNDPSGLNNWVWFQFAWLSNALANPKVLACPSDALVRPAKEYSLSPNGGLMNPNHQNNAISYFIGLDSSALVPNSVLSGDRNIKYSSLGGGCSAGVNPVASILPWQESPTGWRSGLHGPSGNILLHDGRVEQTSNETVNRLFTRESDDNGSIHFQLPRP